MEVELLYDYDYDYGNMLYVNPLDKGLPVQLPKKWLREKPSSPTDEPQEPHL